MGHKNFRQDLSLNSSLKIEKPMVLQIVNIQL